MKYTVFRSEQTSAFCNATYSPSAAYTYIEWPSSETLILATDAAFTRLRDNQPWVMFARILNRSEVVFVQVEAGRESML